LALENDYVLLKGSECGQREGFLILEEQYKAATISYKQNLAKIQHNLLN